ncbi:uncharacterized protein LOC134852011 [Symsagittifera roscoffensis]|uniref:uncharacterized protein LOC134852011 n=1 Tax=Symsagittifera roscoffensis TaxID=84072 RepID=UPI00307C0876
MGWFFFNSVNVLLCSIKMSEDVLLGRYNQKMLYVMKTFKHLNDKKFKTESQREEIERAEREERKVVFVNRFEVDYHELFRGYQLRWLLYQDMQVDPNHLGRFMTPPQLLLVNREADKMLDSFPVIRQLHYGSNEVMLRNAKVQFYQRDETIFKQCEYDASIYILINGRIGMEFRYISPFEPSYVDTAPLPIESSAG